jgi:hypothetical protein
LNHGAWAALAELLGFDTTHRSEIPPQAWSTWGISPEDPAGLDSLEVLAAEPGFRLLLVSGDIPWGMLRRMMLGVRRLNSDELVVWWWARTKNSANKRNSTNEISVAMVDEHVDGRLFVRRMDVDRDELDPIGVRQWAALSVRDLAAGDVVDRTSALRRHVREVLEQEGLTREFFRGFERALGLLREEICDGPEEERARHDVALATLLRLVFLYFLQLRGALDGDRRFVLRHLRQARADGRNFYRTVLRPLFFGALNRPVDEREPEAEELGNLPFLNGGLFEPLPVERAHPRMTWSDDVFGEVVEGLLERYHFAAEEMQGADEQRAVDPEMLGRVFEGLMYGESRQNSGSFYTPRDIVRSLVDEALGGYLSDAAPLSDEQLAALSNGRPVALDDETRAAISDALDKVRILDPAVGTGAFLLEALHALRRCRKSVGSDAVRKDDTDDPLAEYRLVRGLIHRHLFGVDIQYTAVRLCELRLWLALLGTLPAVPIDELPPLPNLSHKVCVGNSLLSPTDLVSLRVGEGSFAAWADAVDGESNRALVDELERAQRRYLTTHGSQKQQVRKGMRELERKLQRAMLQTRRETLDAKLEPLSALAASKDLFGGEVTLTDEQQREREGLEAERRAIDEALEALESGREARLAFSYATRFGQLLPEGGFDIIITNPPWVRAHRIDSAQREVLCARYESHRRRLWPGAKRAGIRAPFGPQVDLAALFVERSLELLRDGGRLCGLVPAKLFSSLHGSALREQLSQHALVALEDYSDGSRRIFDATVYPAMLHVKKKAAPRRRKTTRLARKPAPMRLSVWRGENRRSWRADSDSLYAAGDHPGAPWILAEPDITHLFDKMREASVPLGEVERLQPVRGLFTGCNDVFVHDEKHALELLGPHFDTFSRPVLSGRDVRPWSVEPDRRILWPYDDALELRRDLPECLRRYFAGHGERLEGRSDHRLDEPLWQMFRVKDDITRPKVVWRDLSPKLEAALAPADVVPLNTIYFIALGDDVEARLLAALFNSPALRAFAYALGERARGGWRRHFAWVMRLLPVPRRFVEFLQADTQRRAGAFADLLALERRIRTDKARPVAELAGLLYGLDADEVACLQGWRTGEGACGEVA